MNEKMPSSMTMKVTKNYSLFKTLEGNREVLSIRKKKIKSSIETIGYIPSPIIVNEKMEIIDGQGRFEALKELAFPIYYIVVPGLTLEHCIAMNINSTNWTRLDYIKSYAAQGNDNYINLLSLIDKYPQIPIVCLVASTGALTNNSAITSGSLVMASSEMPKIVDVLDWVKENVLPLRPHVTGQFERFACAIIWAYRFSTADKDRLVAVLNANKFDLPPAPTVKYFLEQFTKLYNKSLRSTRVYLNVEYEQYCIKTKQSSAKIAAKAHSVKAKNCKKNNTLERAVAP